MRTLFLWEPVHLSSHINYKELLAAFNGLRAFAAGLSSTSILLRIDNTTAVAYVNKMGGIPSPVLKGISRDIWQFCEARSLFIFASYIPSAQNVPTDQPRHQFTWDVQKVISLLESWWALDGIPLEQLTWRLAMLLALASWQRVQTLAAISLTNLR